MFEVRCTPILRDRSDGRLGQERSPGTAAAAIPAKCRIYNKEVPSAASSPIILAENLTKVYAAGRLLVTAVRGVSLSIEPGEFVAIVGPSGSGKSTLFYLLGGLTQATSGRVVIDGVDFATLSDSERTQLRKHRIGFVFQKFNLLPTLTAMGNIEIAYAVSGRKEPMDVNYLDHLSGLLSIPRPARPPALRVERRRTAESGHRARSDTKTGDRAGRRANGKFRYEELRRRSRDVAEIKQPSGPDNLMITHNPEAASIAGRILYMRDGEIVREEKGTRQYSA